jgi:hypothetical protein
MIPDRIAREISALEAYINAMLAATVSYATFRAVTAPATLPADQPGVVAGEEIKTFAEFGIIKFLDRVWHPMLETVPVNDLCEKASHLPELDDTMPPRTCPAMHTAVRNELFLFHLSPLI